MKAKKLILSIGAAVVLIGTALVVLPELSSSSSKTYSLALDESEIIKPMVISPEEKAAALKQLEARGLTTPSSNMMTRASKEMNSAAYKGDKELLKLYIQAGTEPYYSAENLVHFAATSKDIEVTKLVLSIPGIRLHEDASFMLGKPIEHAIMENNKAAIKLMVNHPNWGKTDDQLHAILTNDAKALKAIIDKNEFYLKPVLQAHQMAAALGHTECLQLIIEAMNNKQYKYIGPKVAYTINSCNFIEKSALHFAIKNGHTECVKLLLNTPGISLDIGSIVEETKDDLEYLKFFTPLEYATKKGMAEIADMLRNAGVK